MSAIPNDEEQEMTEEHIERRDRLCKLLYVSTDGVLRIIQSVCEVGHVFNGGPGFDRLQFKTISDLPTGSEITDVHYDYQRDAFAFRVWNACFPLCPLGQQMEEIKVEFEASPIEQEKQDEAERKQIPDADHPRDASGEAGID